MSRNGDCCSAIDRRFAATSKQILETHARSDSVNISVSPLDNFTCTSDFPSISATSPRENRSSPCGHRSTMFGSSTESSFITPRHKESASLSCARPVKIFEVCLVLPDVTEGEPPTATCVIEEAFILCTTLAADICHKLQSTGWDFMITSANFSSASAATSASPRNAATCANVIVAGFTA
jgi:hypothetical protein